uniref:uncharacterized protein LOC120339405 n=1 Tax=Styela clava TaxID=7725 RepID=UPI00193A0180|nr:uncharacterized protein LOC120339405 [Styela clava]
MATAKKKSSSKKGLISNGSNSSKSSNKKSAAQDPESGGCLRKLSAILTRVLFALHAGIALWRVSFDYPKIYLYFLSIGLVFLLFEMVFTLAVRQGKEYKWFCPSVLFYLMSVVPCLWFLELARFKGAMIAATQVGICDNNATLGLLINPMESSNTNSSNNRTRRSADSSLKLLEQSQYVLNEVSQSETLLKRIRRQSVADDPPKREKKRRRENRRRKPKPENLMNENATQITKAVNGTSITPTTVTTKLKTLSTTTKLSTTSTPLSSTPTSSTPVMFLTTIPTDVTSSSAELAPPLMTSASTIIVTTDQNDKDIGQKIKDGFSNIEKETANLLNKTKDVIGQLNRWVDRSTWILLLHQVLLFVLVIGRWLLPKGEITREQLSQLLLVFIGVGADILEFVTETLDGDELDQTSCSSVLHYVIYGVWSWSLLQFTLVLTASKSRKTRVGFESAHAIEEQSGTGCCGNSLFASADLWGILVTLFLQDVPFLATRLYILIVYDLKHQMMIFFTGKNALVVILQVYRIIVLKLSRNKKKKNDIDETELEPLRGTLAHIARRATMVDNNGTLPSGTTDDIRDATFKPQRDGSVVLKIHLEGEETLRKKRQKQRAQSSAA